MLTIKHGWSSGSWYSCSTHKITPLKTRCTIVQSVLLMQFNHHQLRSHFISNQQGLQEIYLGIESIDQKCNLSHFELQTFKSFNNANLKAQVKVCITFVALWFLCHVTIFTNLNNVLFHLTTINSESCLWSWSHVTWVQTTAQFFFDLPGLPPPVIVTFLQKEKQIKF